MRKDALDSFGASGASVWENLFGLGLAVAAAIGALLAVGQQEHLGQLLLGGGDAAGILAAQNIDQLFGQADVPLFGQLAVTDHVDRGVGVLHRPFQT